MVLFMMAYRSLIFMRRASVRSFAMFAGISLCSSAVGAAEATGTWRCRSESKFGWSLSNDRQAKYFYDDKFVSTFQIRLLNCAQYEDLMAKQTIAYGSKEDAHLYNEGNCDKDLSLAMKTFPTFGHLDGKLPFVVIEDERVVDDGLVDLRSDKFGLEKLTLYARLSTNLNFEMNRDFSVWRFIITWTDFYTSERAKRLELPDRAETSISSVVGDCVQLN
jgi:hypothetical protein